MVSSIDNCYISDKTELRPSDIQPVIKVYNKRWLILSIYISYAALSTFQWVEYSIITNVIVKYYNVSASAVDWTAMIFMVMWPTLVFPASFVIDKMGLRVAGLIGVFATAIGAGIKIFSVGQDQFYVVLLGQTVVAVSQIFILSLPPKIAVTWFKPSEISTVCSLGIFGMTLGSALGFLVPPMIVNVKNLENLEEIGSKLKIMCYGLALAIAPLALTVVFYFPKEPLHPPSQAMWELRQNKEDVTFSVFAKSIKTLLTNKAFLIHAVAYGCNVSIFSAIGTLLNQIILNYFPGAQEDAGRMGLVMIATGMIGSVLIGIVLDKTHKYKETAFMIFILAAVSMTGFLLALEMKSKLLVYLAIAIFGCFLNSYLPAGVEFATEITFPSPESTVSGILMATSQILAVTLTTALGFVNEKYGTYYVVIIQVMVLAVGTILTLLTPNNLKRQEAFYKDVEFNVVPQND